MRKSQMLIADSIFWVLSSVGLIIISVFPQIPMFCANVLGIESPANFVFLVVLFMTLIKLFGISVDVSITKNKLKNFVEEYAIKDVDLVGKSSVE
jgi:hypothetical protein